MFKVSEYENILILDTETTGLNPDVDCPIEVGAVLWNIQHGTLQCWSAVIQSDVVGPTWIHGINEELAALGTPRDQVYKGLEKLVSLSDAIVAHNAVFDKNMLPELNSTWIDSMDIEWPRKSNRKDLVSIALAHGVPVTSAHRALSDCLILVNLFERAQELGLDVPHALERASRPKVLIQSFQSFKDNHLAKEAGFRWKGNVKRWERQMPLEDAQEANWAFEWAPV